jgi:quercetin dioxygenase-like cupin family protein
MDPSWAAVFLGLLTTVFGVVAIGQPLVGGGFTELHRAEVAQATDLEVVMGLIERTGESTGSKHYHPGGEFGFVLEGAVTVVTERESEMTLKAGASFYQPPGEWHVVSTTTQGAKTVVFRILKKGEPMVVEVQPR